MVWHTQPQASAEPALQPYKVEIFVICKYLILYGYLLRRLSRADEISFTMDADKLGWSSGPDNRGSFDILWTCLIVLALCVWTAVHPNNSLIPSPRISLLSRLGLMLVAIIFPEILISSAWRQLRSTQWLRATIHKKSVDGMRTARSRFRVFQSKDVSHHEDQEPHSLLPVFEFEIISEGTPSVHVHEERINFDPTSEIGTATVQQTPSQEHSSEEIVPRGKKSGTGLEPWTSEQAFFAFMGGFAIENSYLDPTTNAKCNIRRLVTVSGVAQLAELTLITPPSQSEIEERSKADIIAKTFVLSQINWFGLQVIGGLIQKLSVTPIEIHTAIHVLCTIIIYLLWLDKPYDVRSSLLLKDPHIIDLGALSCFSKTLVELYTRVYSEYEKTRVEYWRDRVVRAANNILDHDPAPSPPKKE